MMPGPDLAPFPGIPSWGTAGSVSRDAAGEGDEGLTGSAPAESFAHAEGGRADCHPREMFFPLAVCREDPPHRDSRPGPSVPAGELPTPAGPAALASLQENKTKYSFGEGPSARAGISELNYGM